VMEKMGRARGQDRKRVKGEWKAVILNGDK
jgi:hypothetical protein